MRYFGALRTGTVLFGLIGICGFDASFHPAAAMAQICRAAQADNLNVRGAHEVFEACTFVTMTCAFSGHGGGQAAVDKCVEDKFRDGARNSDPNSPDTIYIRAHLSGAGPARHSQKESDQRLDDLLDRCNDDHSEAKARIEACTAMIRSSDDPLVRGTGYLAREQVHLLELRDYPSAIADANGVLQFGRPQDADTALLGRGMAYAALKQYDRAVADFTKVIQLRPQENLLEAAYNQRGKAYFDAQQYESAAADYAEYVRLSPQGEGAENAYYKRAVALGHLHRYGEALDALSACLRINPRNASALVLRDTYENTLMNASAQN